MWLDVALSSWLLLLPNTAFITTTTAIKELLQFLSIYMYWRKNGKIFRLFVRLSICWSVHLSVHPFVSYPLWAIQPGLIPSQLALRPSTQIWLDRPEGGWTDELMNRQMD